MKNLRKLFAMLLALGLILVLWVPAYAGETAQTGSVTVDNGENEKTYKLYQVLIPEGEGYKVTSDWESKVKVKNGKVSVNFDGDSEGSELSEPVSSETVMAFLNHAKELDPTGTATAADGQAIFSDIPYGYYLIDYADGTGGLFELKDSAYTIEKKGAGGPGVVKKIKLANGDLVDWTTVSNGDVVSFQVEVTLPSKEEWEKDKDYEWHYPCSIYDEVSAGLQRNNDVEVKLDGRTVIKPGETKYTLSDAPGDIIHVKYTDENGKDDRKKFSILFGNGREHGSEDGTLAFLKLHPGAKLTLSYSATVINRAIQTPEEFNEVTYYFGGEERKDKVYVYDFTIIIDKRDSGDNTIGLDGAEFVLQNAEGKFYWSDRKTDDSHHAGDKVEWKEAQLNKDTGEFTLPNDVKEENRLSMVRVTNKWNLNGVTHFEGIPTGTYYLYEIKAPEGYARRKEPVKIEIFHTETGTDGKEKFGYKINDGEPAPITSGDVPWGGQWNQLQLTTQVGNIKAGALLPTTGGIGTTLFYVGGGALVVGAACVILFKNRKGE